MRNGSFSKKSIFTYLSAAVLFSAAFAGAVCLRGTARAETSRNAVTGITVSLNQTLAVNYYVSLPEGYSEPQMIFNQGEEDEETVSKYAMDGDEYVFSYTGATVLTVGEEITASAVAKNASGKTEKIGSRDTSVQEYWESVLDMTREELEYTTLEYVSLRSLAVNFLNYASKAQIDGGITENLADAGLTNEEKALVYGYDSIYQADWTKRTPTYEGADGEDFHWTGGESLNLAQGVAMRFTFSYQGGITDDLQAKVVLGSRTETVSVEPLPAEEQTESGVTLYTVTTPPLKATEFSSQTGVRIYHGKTPVSSRLVYSVNRCIDKIYVDGSAPQSERDKAAALYAFGKAAAWYGYKDSVEYTVLPAVNDNGIVTCSKFDYTYDDGRMLQAKEGSGTFGQYVYLDGNAYDTSHIPEGGTIAEGVTLAYSPEGNLFTVTLDGADLEHGLLVYYANLEIVVKSNSTISGLCYRDWNDKGAKKGCTIGADSGKISVSGEPGAALYVNGGILAPGGVAVNGAEVNVKSSQAGYNGVETNGSLTVENDAILSVEYTGEKVSASRGISAVGNISVNGATLVSKGFNYGIFLDGAADAAGQNFTADGEARVEIEAVTGGISSHSVNRDLKFINGAVKITAAFGIDYANVTVDAAELTILATGGNGIGQDSPAKLTTVGGIPETGKISVFCDFYNPYWDMKGRALWTSGMEIDGGTIRFEVRNHAGVIETVQGAALNFDQCDVYLRSDGSAHGIYANAGNEVITVATGARVFVEKCGLPVGSWVGVSETVQPVRIYIYGDMAAVGCGGGIGEWESNAKLVEGTVRYMNG